MVLRAPARSPRGIIASMPAFVISEVEILDESQGQRYRELAEAAIARHGGRYIVRGAKPEVPKVTGPPAGGWSWSSSRAWTNSGAGTSRTTTPEALAVREATLTRRLLSVSGVDDADAT